MFDELNRYQKPIAIKLLEGKSNQEISDELKICIQTVKYHITRIFVTYKVKSKYAFMSMFMVPKGNMYEVQDGGGGTTGISAQERKFVINGN